MLSAFSLSSVLMILRNISTNASNIIVYLWIHLGFFHRKSIPWKQQHFWFHMHNTCWQWIYLLHIFYWDPSHNQKYKISFFNTTEPYKYIKERSHWFFIGEWYGTHQLDTNNVLGGAISKFVEELHIHHSRMNGLYRLLLLEGIILTCIASLVD